MDKEKQEQIKVTISKEEIKDIIIKELKSKNLLKENKNTYQCTEKLLYTYPLLPDVIKTLEAEIEDLKEEDKQLPPAPAKSDTLVLRDNDKTYIYRDVTLGTTISELQQMVARARSIKRQIERVTNKLKDDEYFPLIEEIYYNRKTYSDIENFYGWGSGTISYNKSRLINKLKLYFYPINFIDELTK